MKPKFFYLAMASFLPALTQQADAKLAKHIHLQQDSLKTETSQKPEP